MAFKTLNTTDIKNAWKLKHGLYGFKDRTRYFYLSVREELAGLGFVDCKLDSSVFCLHGAGKLRLICCHVDAFLTKRLDNEETDF